MDEPAEFDPTYAVDAYRRIIARRDRATTVEERGESDRIAVRLRPQWRSWEGDDSLHEHAFGEGRFDPVE
jgi:hypothetical protein